MKPDNTLLLAELARVRVLFQARALAAHMGVVMPVEPPSNPSPPDPAIYKKAMPIRSRGLK